MILEMAKPQQTPAETAFEVTCPCCNALLKVDYREKAVIAHTPAVKPKTFNDIEEAARAMKEQDTRKESIFRQSVEAQKHASDLLEKKFQEALKKAKASPDTGKPIRDFDLD
jgi:ribulose kinase